MKAFFTLVLIGLVALGVYNFLNDNSPFTLFTDDLPEHITVEGDSVTVDAGDYDVRFEPVREYQKTYMLFGGGYSKDKSSISPITLFGLGMVDAKNIYARYPDFHRCDSPGAAIAQPKVKWLNLIPAEGVDIDIAAEAPADRARQRHPLGMHADLTVALHDLALDPVTLLAWPAPAHAA